MHTPATGGLPARPRRAWRGAALAVLALTLAAPLASALPSYAQQTDKPCSACHTIAFGPALTAYGRQFKLNGYTWGEAKGSVPLALMTVVGYSQISKDLPEAAAPHFSDNDNLAVNELTGFYAGRITQNVGAFIEVAYSGVEKHLAWGAFDVRFAKAGAIGSTAVVAGLSINNNPTVSDLWNSTPVWSFPYTGSELAPAPGAAPVLFDGISERVLGPTAYVMINDWLYLEAGAYKALSDNWLNKVGLYPDDNLHLDGVAPYWRASMQWQKEHHYYSVGVVGLNVKQQPDPVAPDIDRFNDFGVDATYQYSDGGTHTVNANLAYVHETRHLDASFAAEASDSVTNNLSTVHLDLGYAYKQTWVASVGWFDTHGTANDALYNSGDPIDGSANGSPNSRGYQLQLEYVPFGKPDSRARPWLNARFGLQYTGYQRFNGGSSNYDGLGRNASDNNTLFAFIWLAI